VQVGAVSCARTPAHVCLPIGHRDGVRHSAGRTRVLGLRPTRPAGSARWRNTRFRLAVQLPTKNVGLRVSRPSGGEFRDEAVTEDALSAGSR